MTSEWESEPERWPFPETGRVYRVWDSLAALRHLPDASVDAVITDPPYSSGGFTRGDRNQDPAAKYVQSGTETNRVSFSGDNRDGRSWLLWCALWMSECLRVAKTGGYLLSFADWRMEPLAADAIQAGGWLWRGTAVWDKGLAARAPHTGYFRHQAEYVVWGTKGPLEPASHGGPFPGVYHVPVNQQDKFHMTGKPTELMRELVKCVPENGIILDPFAGSGTTIVACELERRRGVGFEREPENVAISTQRVEAARAGMDARAKLEGQRALFAAAGDP